MPRNRERAVAQWRSPPQGSRPRRRIPAGRAVGAWVPAPSPDLPTARPLRGGRLFAPLGFPLHLRQARVVVRELVQVRERDLPSEYRVIIGDVRHLVEAPVLELDVEAHAELLDVEWSRLPVDADLSAHAACLLG